ncbi:MAG: hypothetical protein JWM10_3691 [Myxococcaceae bacterium]|nr:hypothetical protein [Myxococcaceae bacterium]
MALVGHRHREQGTPESSVRMRSAVGRPDTIGSASVRVLMPWRLASSTPAGRRGRDRSGRPGRARRGPPRADVDAGIEGRVGPDEGRASVGDGERAEVGDHGEQPAMSASGSVRQKFMRGIQYGGRVGCTTDGRPERRQLVIGEKDAVYRRVMATEETRAAGLAGWRRGALALAVAAQGLALARTSPWLSPTGAAVLAVAVGAATLPVVRGRRAWMVLAADLALTGVAFGMAGAVIGGLTREGAGAWSAINLLVTAGWWWALRAPVTLARWRAPREVAATLGASLLATAGALVATGTTDRWSMRACLALGAVAMTCAWWRRKSEGDAKGTRAPAGEGNEAPYRTARSQAPTYERRARWLGWALPVGALLWSGALVQQGARRLAHFWPRSGWSAVRSAMEAVRVEDDPCRVGAGHEGRRDFDMNTAVGGPLNGPRGTVWASGAISVLRPTGGDYSPPPVNTCLPAAYVQRWIAHASADEASDRAELTRLVQYGEYDSAIEQHEALPLLCTPGHWCSMSMNGHEGVTTPGHAGGQLYQLSCTLLLNGQFRLGERRHGHQRWGRVPAASARALIELVEAVASARGPVTMHSLAAIDSVPAEAGEWDHTRGGDPTALVVSVGSFEDQYRVDFPQARAVGEFLWRRLCWALPPRDAHRSDEPVVLPDAP